MDEKSSIQPNCVTEIGKRVFDELYVHVSYVERLSAAHKELFETAWAILSSEVRSQVNVIKLNSRAGRISFLEYQAFDDDPFPILAKSWVLTPPNSQIYARRYDESLNPPVLHRKELLVIPEHPGRDQWKAVTQTAESLGLFDDVSGIGFRLNWLRLIEAKGYRLVDGHFVPIGNDDSGGSSLLQLELGEEVLISRHRTALHRMTLSAPVQALARCGLLQKDWTIFDYGCGRCSDMECLAAEGYLVSGWDPHYRPGEVLREADVVNLGFVINVIEDPAERVEALQKAFSLAKKVMSVGVMLYSACPPPGRPFRDGYLTSRNTFQKYFSQSEFKDYLELVLGTEVFIGSPGVAFVFADKDLEQRFASDRYRNRFSASRLLAAEAVGGRSRQPELPRVTKAEQRIKALESELSQLWKQTLELGRLPEAEEVSNLDLFINKVGSFGKAVRMMLKHYSSADLAAAANARMNDLTVYFSLQSFGKRPPYRKLEPALQRDVKAFFGDYKSAMAAGAKLLMDIAQAEKIFEACAWAAENGLGYLDAQRSLQLHTSLVERLPSILRVYIGCGLTLFGDLNEIDLLKIHVTSGKLTLMQFDDFNASPLPRMVRRIKINIKHQEVDVFEYGGEYPMPLLYWKSRYINEDFSQYADQQSFEQELEGIGLNSGEGYGLPEVDLLRQLALQRLQINGFTLTRATSFPPLEERCGRYLRYRDFIECGETQQRLRLPNLPKEPETYNALYDLAVHVLDPVIEYFGAIRLTYGFCSHELGKQIKARVAPKLDQHAAGEKTRLGTHVCDRSGAACDFIVDDENMFEVANWIVNNLSFDRMYVYSPNRPIHISYGPEHVRQVVQLLQGQSGRLVPKIVHMNSKNSEYKTLVFH
jgi:DNA phosphorothioation-associated putative methyltransferase